MYSLHRLKTKKVKLIKFKRKTLFREKYLINLINGGVYFCNKKARNIISFIIENNGTNKLQLVKKFSSDAKDLLSSLEQEGFLKNSKYTREKKSLSGSNPLFLQWHITQKCNLRCRHCYLKEYKKETDFKTLKKHLLQIERLAKSFNKKLLIAITGGEPLLYPQLIPLIKYLNHRNIVKEIHIASNGTLLTNQLATEFKKLGVKKFQISIDGIEKTHDEIRGKGSFKKAINGIKIARKNGLKVCVQTVVSKKNINEVDDILKTLRDMDVNEVIFSLFVPIGTGILLKNLALSTQNTKKLFYILEELSRKYKKPKILKHRPLWCLVNRKGGGVCDFDSGVCLMPSGDLYPCSRLPISIGNLNKQGIFEIWYNSDFMWLHRKSKNLKGKCHDCPFIQKCGGCRAMAFAYFNNSLAEDPTCWLNQKN